MNDSLVKSKTKSAKPVIVAVNPDLPMTAQFSCVQNIHHLLRHKEITDFIIRK